MRSKCLNGTIVETIYLYLQQKNSLYLAIQFLSKWFVMFATLFYHFYSFIVLLRINYIHISKRSFVLRI